MKTWLAIGMLVVCALVLRQAHATDGAADSMADTAASRQVLVMLRMAPQHFHPDATYGGRYPDDGGRAGRRRLAEAIATDHGLKLLSDWPMPVIGIDCYVMEREKAVLGTRLLHALSRDPRVVWAQPMNLFHGLDGGDPLYAVQPAAKFWHLAELQRASTGRNVRVAIIDSGVDRAHPDLIGQVQLQENFVDTASVTGEAHGTAVAGIVAARAGNGIGIAGVAPEARLMALRACSQTAGHVRCSSFWLGKAINFAVMHDAKILNLSVSGPRDRLLETLFDVAAARGIAVIGAVDPDRADGGFPASYPGVVPVAGTASASTAPRGALFAPGTDIPTTLPGARWGLVSGTSYAAAHVTGLLALVAQLQPGASPAQLRRQILTFPNSQPMTKAGIPASDGAAQAGTIDACATISGITGACVCTCVATAVPKGSPGP